MAGSPFVLDPVAAGPRPGPPPPEGEGAPARGGQGHGGADEIALGPRTRLQAARILEQSLGAVWVALLEARGPEGGGEWELVIDGLRLVRKPAGEGPDHAPDGVVGPAFIRGER